MSPVAGRMTSPSAGRRSSRPSAGMRSSCPSAGWRSSRPGARRRMSPTARRSMAPPGRVTYPGVCTRKDAPPRRVTRQGAGDKCRRRKNRPDGLFHCLTPNRTHENGQVQSKKTRHRGLQQVYRENPPVPFPETVRTASPHSVLVRVRLPPIRPAGSHSLPQREFARLSLSRESAQLRYVKRQRKPHSG
jgi:hypothetical protein